MIVPTIRIVIGDDNRGICPETRLLDGIDGIDYELLFQYGIGIGGMTVLILPNNVCSATVTANGILSLDAARIVFAS